MPSRRGGNCNYDYDQDYSEHDDGNAGRRHVSSYGGGLILTRTRNRNARYRPSVVPGDRNVSSRTTENTRYGNPHEPIYVRGNDRNGRDLRPPFSSSQSGWYDVTILHGKKYPKQYLFNTIHQLIQPVPLVPYYVKIHGDDLTFFVDNEELAEAIYKANQCIEMLDGWKMQTRVQPVAPDVDINENDATTMNTIRGVMSSLFDPTTLHMNLSKFHANEEFRRREMFVPLNGRLVWRTVFSIIAKNVPNLRSLDLSDNMIYHANQMEILPYMSDLKSLNLSKNLIRSLAVLNGLRAMKLETLVLHGNPLRKQCRRQTIYVRKVRNLFKSLRVLDGMNLLPTVVDGIEGTQSRLPLSHDSFLCNLDGATITKQFLLQFFDMYDSQTSRNGLLVAYADHAQLSMTAVGSNRTMFFFDMRRYIRASRNWKSRMDASEIEIRSSLLLSGNEAIVEFLNRLPKTQHDLTTLSLDLLVYKPELISLSVCGVYRETDNPGGRVIAFSRTFVIVPTGSGVSIISDKLSITRATQTQVSEMSRTTTASTSSVPTTSPEAIRAAVPTASNSSEWSSQQRGMLKTSAVETGRSNVVDSDLRREQEMVTALARRTGLNKLWARKCLVEMNWDFNNAILAFTEFNKIGQIPEEAFDK